LVGVAPTNWIAGGRVMGGFRGFRGVSASIAFALCATLVTPGTATAVGDSPLITSFSPAVAAAGSVVTVLGTGLDPASDVAAQVNGVSAPITSGSATELGITVPTAAGSGPITVTGPSGTGVSQIDLYIPPAGVTVDRVAVAQRVESGTSVPVAFAALGQVALLTMPLAAGDRIAVNVTDSTFDDSTSYAIINILAPDGTAIASPTYFGSSGAFVDPAVATQDGTYTVFVDPRGTTVGSADVTVYRVPADVVVSAVVGGDPVTVSTSVPGQNGKVVFAGVAGQKLAVTLSDSTFGTSETDVVVLGPDGSELSWWWFTETSYFDAVTLPSDGDYTIMIDPWRVSSTGSINVRLATGPADVVVSAVVGGDPVTVSTSVPGQNGRVAFAGVAGQRVAVTLSDSTFGESYMYVQVLGPDGSELTSAGFSETSWFVDPVSLPSDGDYTIVIDPEASSTGSVSVQLDTVPADVVVSALVGGEPVTVSTSVPGQNGQVVFAGVAGQKIAISLADSTFGSTGTWVQMLGPDGSELTRAWLSETSLLVSAVTLPFDGDYTIAIDPGASVTGSASVRLDEVLPVVVAGAVDSSDVLVSTNIAEQNGEVTFDAVAGESVAVETVASTYGTSYWTMVELSLVSPSGATVIPAQHSDTGSFIDPVVLPESGQYRLVVDPQDSTTGSVTLRLRTVPADVVVSGVVGGDPVTVSTSVPGQNGQVVFAGVAGQNVALTLSDSTFGTSGTAVEIFGPDGSELRWAWLSETSLFVNAVTLPSDGDYTILIDPWRSSSTGSVSVRLDEVLPVVVAGAADGSDVVMSISTAGQDGEVTFDAVAGDRIAVETVASTYGAWTVVLSLVSPSGATVIPAQYSEAGSFIESVALPESGQYRLVVDPRYSATGSLTLRLHTVPADVVVSAVVGGDPVTVSTSVPRQNGKVVFAGVAGQTVALTLSNSTFGTSWTSMNVLGPDGSMLMGTSFTAAYMFVHTVKLPSDGDYTIVIDPEASVTGSVTVRLDDVPLVVVAGAANSRNVVVSTTIVGQNGEVTFDAVAGDRVAVQTVTSTFGSPSSSVQLSLVSPSGATVIPASYPVPGSFIEPVVLLESGKYRLVVDPQGSTTGSLTLRVHTVPADVVVSGAVGGDPVTVSTSVPGQNGRVVFAGVAGQKLSVTLAASTLGTSSTAVQVLKPDGSILTGTSFTTTSGFIDTFTLPSDGDYTIAIDPYRAMTGTVNAQVSAVPADAVHDLAVAGGTVVANTSVPGENLRFDTELVAGKKYTLWVYDMPGTTLMTVRDTTGSTLYTDTLPWGNYSVEFTAATSGAHTISFDPQGAVTGTWEVELFSRVGPTQVTLPATSTGWYTTNSLDVYWSASSRESISGYAVVQDTNPTTEPTAVTTTATATTITAPEGESWLHIRAVLADGTLGAVTHSRIQVDTQAPVLGALSSPSHPDSSILYAGRDVELEWDAPEDVSGIAGYSIEATQSPSSTPDATVDLTDTAHTFTLASNGLWYLRVRPIDAAGNVGEPQEYEVNVDAEAPAAPQVSATHQDGVASSQRTLVADFTSGDGDPVATWSAVVDQSPDTVPDPVDGHVEPRLVATLTPGTWWLHVSARDSLGRWGEPTHVQVIVTGADAVVLQPAQSWVWAATAINVACDNGATGLSLATVDAEGTVQNIGPLTTDGDHCSTNWDPTGTVNGERVWPDSDYNLVVVDADGVEVSERVPVTVAVESSTVDRILSDYQAGVIDSTELVDLIFNGLHGDDGVVPARYLVGATEGSLTTEIILRIVALLEPDVRQEVAETLMGNTADASESQTLPPLVQGKLSALTPSLFAAARSSAEGVPACDESEVDYAACKVRYPGFLISYNTNDMGVAKDYEGVPPVVQAVADALAYSKKIYEEMGFSTPTETVGVSLSDNVGLAPGQGYSTSVASPHIGMDVSSMTGVPGVPGVPRDVYYLVSHEYFHQVQYTYFNATDYTFSQPSWWMEATAEWAAHRVQEQIDFPGVVQNVYASSIDVFLKSDAALTNGNSVLRRPDSHWYGAFPLAEYLQDRFQGDEAIRWTWDRIGDGYFGVAPVDAIDDYVQSRGSTYAKSIEQFRLWNYVLSDDSGNIGYSDPDANPGGFWRQRIPGLDRDLYRRVTNTVTLDSQTGGAEGSAKVAPSNTAYVEITKPAGVSGVATIVVTRLDPGQETYYDDDLSAARASIIPVAQYPELCADAQSLSYVPSDSTSATVAVDQLQGAFRIPANCSTITLAITNTSKGGAYQRFHWSVTFEEKPLSLSNGTIELGVNPDGTLIAGDVGLRFTGEPDTEVLSWYAGSSAWFISDGTTTGWVTSWDDGPQRALVTTSSSRGYSDQTMTINSTMNDTLAVKFNYRPTTSSQIYALDVTVARTATSLTSGPIKFNYAFDFFEPPARPAYESLLWLSPTGEQPAFVEYLGRSVTVINPVWFGYHYEGGSLAEMIQLNLGELEVGESVTFTMYLGLSHTTGPNDIDAADVDDWAISMNADTTGSPVYALFAVSDLTYHPSPAA
jgi:hypothetical protein